MEVYFFVAILMVVALFFRYKNKKAALAIEMETDGKHIADFKVGRIVAFIANNKLYYKEKNRITYYVANLDDIDYVVMNRHRRGTYMGFCNKDKKSVGKMVTLGEKKINEFYELIHKYVDGVEILEI